MSYKKIYYSMVVVSATFMASCTMINDASTNKNKHAMEYQGDLGQWNYAVKNIISDNELSEYDVKNKYAQSQAYHPVFMGQLWIEDMAIIAAKNPDFRTAVNNMALGNKNAYAQKLQKNPQAIRSLSESYGAFRDVLAYISQQDAQYNNIAKRTEAFARKQPIPDMHITPRAVNYFSLHDYSTTSTVNPSVMERILNVAAFKIMKLDKDNAYRHHIAQLTHNHAMTQCFETAKRNSAQCEAAAYDNYDLSYCMARHNVSEVAGCFSWILP